MKKNNLFISRDRFLKFTNINCNAITKTELRANNTNLTINTLTKIGKVLVASIDELLK
jgi:hypothetical protein